MASVTVLGASSQVIKLNYDTQETTDFARQVAGLITSGVLSGNIIPASDKNGGPPPVPAGKTGEFVQTKNGTVILPHGYTAVVETAKTAIVFGSSDPGQMILAGTATDLTYFAAAGGSGSVVAGGSHNRIVVPGSNGGEWMVTTGKGDDIIQIGGSGQSTVDAGAGRNAIGFGKGDALLTSRGDDTVTAGGGSMTIDASAAGSDLVFGGSGDLLFVGGGGGATIYGGSGSTSYFGGTATQPTHGGNGHGHDHHSDDRDDEHQFNGRHGHHSQDHDDDDKGHGSCADDQNGSGKGPTQIVHGGSAGDNYLFAGDGVATLFGGGNNDQLFTYGGYSQTLIGSAGSATLSGAYGWGNDTFISGTGNESIVGGTGADLFVGGRGNDTVFATDGARDTFQFIRGQAGGTELVQNIYDSADVKIKLTNYGSHEKQNALASQTTNGSSVSLSLSDGTQITFENITHLTSKNFV